MSSAKNIAKTQSTGHYKAMQTLTLVLADQLFEKHPAIATTTDWVLIESQQECERLNYHKFCLVYLYTCMREYADFLKNSGQNVEYWDIEKTAGFEIALSELAKKYPHIQVIEPNDKSFRIFLDALLQKYFEKVTYLWSDESEQFLTSKSEFDYWLINRGTKQLIMASFYTWQRRRLKILINPDGKPVGGSWSFDAENRKKLPKTVAVPERNWEYHSVHFKGVSQHIEKLFSKHPGIVTSMWLPTNHLQARAHFVEFLDTCMQQFGPFEDALSTRNHALFHSAISPLLNNGLLTPRMVIDTVLDYYFEHPEIPLSSIEGFIRQIIGWREWIRGLYEHRYQLDHTKYNYLEHTIPLPDWFYYPDQMPPEVQKNIPLKLALEKVSEFGWAHHIERLMVLSNWMLLSRYNPNECYDWFRSQFVDAYEWVMVPNVYGMGLYADGGMFATKPYISGGNYLKKMSDYPSYDDWGDEWTKKYWDFIRDYRHLFSSNPRMAAVINKRFGDTNSQHNLEQPT